MATKEYKKITELTAITAPAAADVVHLVDDTDGLSKQATLANVTKGLDLTLATTTLPISAGGTGNTTAQAAIDALTQVSGATNEHVLTKDTGTGNAVFKASAAGFSNPMTTRGDIIVTTAGPTTSRLALGAANSVLTSDGLDIGYATSLTLADLTHTGRHKLDKGADLASPAGGILTLGGDGNVFDVTGTNTINEILATSWQAGSVVHLQFDGILTITHNSGGTNDILLGDQSNMTTAAGDVLSLFFNGTDWVEISRSVVSAGGGSGAFSDAGDPVVLNTTTKRVTIGSTLGGKLGINGDADEVQLQVQGHSTQTSKLLVIENSAATEQMSLTNAGVLNVAGNITVGGTVDGRDLATDGTKLDGIETSATADQTGAEIKTAYEGENFAANTILGNNTGAPAGPVELTTTQVRSLINVEDGADVTDTANVTAAFPISDATSIVEGSADNTKELRFEVDGNTTGITGVVATSFTTAKTLTLPDATDTLVGKATTDILTNKTIDADGTGNVVTNIGASEVKADIINGQTLVTAVGTDHVLIEDATDGALKKALISDFASAGGDMASATYDPAAISEQLVGLTAAQTLSNKTFTNTGLKIQDTDASHGLSLVPGTNQTADRVLNIINGDADRTIDLAGNLTVSASVTLTNGTHSGTNTGDQTITLTGDVTGSGTGSFAATIASDSVTYDKMQDTTVTDVVLGRSTAGGGTVEEIACTAAARTVLDDASVSAMVNTLGGGTATGTGVLVRQSSPTLITPALGTPASGVATNLTGLPLTTGVTGTLPVANGGTGVTTSTGTGNTVLSASPTFTGTPVLPSTITIGANSFIRSGAHSLTLTTTGTTNATIPSGTSTLMNLGTAQSVTAGIKKTFSQSATTAGLNLGTVSAAPSAPAEGDIWYQGSDDTINYRQAATTRTVANLAEAQTLTNKTIAFASNTLTNVMSTTTAQSVTAGIKKTFQANATNAGMALAGVTADPSAQVAGDIFYRSDLKTINFSDGTTRFRLNPIKDKSITVEDPANSDLLVMWMNNDAETVTGVSFSSLAGTSVAFNILYHATLIQTSGAQTVHSDTCTSGTAEWNVTPSGTAAMAATGIVMLSITTVTGSVTDFNVTVHYRQT